MSLESLGKMRGCMPQNRLPGAPLGRTSLAQPPPTQIGTQSKADCDKLQSTPKPPRQAASNACGKVGPPPKLKP